jgi:hypothetical protein
MTEVAPFRCSGTLEKTAVASDPAGRTATRSVAARQPILEANHE